MILYFTGTGNTKFAADCIADHIYDETVSLNGVLKYKMPLRFCSEKPFVVCAPIYAWGFPKIIEKLLRKAEFTGSRQIYFVGTMESQSGECGKAMEELAHRKGMLFMGFCGVPMPNNYLTGGNIPTKEESMQKIMRALPLLCDISYRIGAGETIEKVDKTPFSAIASGAVNVLFNKYMITSKNFRVSEDCVSCGKCARVCPVNNVKLSGAGVPGFGDHCLNCFSCVNRCPVKAINIGRRTEKTGRYVCPEYSDWKLKGLID